MIVRPAGDWLLLITQPDHAALARRIMEHWKPLEREPRRESILLAIEQHDNGWHEPDAEPMVDATAGTIVDFLNVSAEVKRGIWPRAVRRVPDPWAAALVAQHAIVLHERFRESDEWTEFFAELEAARRRDIERARLSLEDVIREYAYVRIGDLISLTFCNGWTEEQTYDHAAIRLDGERLTISPDPFDGREIPFEVAARELPNRRYGSGTEGRAAWFAAREVVLAGSTWGRPREGSGAPHG